MVIMAFEHHGQREIVHNILTGFNAFFSTMYTLGKPWCLSSSVGNTVLQTMSFIERFALIEAIVKIVGLRHFYFTVPWNVFDFSLVLFSILDLFLIDVEWNLPFPPALLRVIRVFRIGRVLRLIKVMKKF